MPCNYKGIAPKWSACNNSLQPLLSATFRLSKASDPSAVPTIPYRFRTQTGAATSIFVMVSLLRYCTCAKQSGLQFTILHKHTSNYHLWRAFLARSCASNTLWTSSSFLPRTARPRAFKISMSSWFVFERSWSAEYTVASAVCPLHPSPAADTQANKTSEYGEYAGSNADPKTPLSALSLS